MLVNVQSVHICNTHYNEEMKEEEKMKMGEWVKKEEEDSGWSWDEIVMNEAILHIFHNLNLSPY